MADAQLGEARQFNLHSAGTDLVEGAALAVKSAGGSITVDGFTETGANALVTVAVGGGTPHDSVDSGNPVKIGGVAKTTMQTAVASGDRTHAWFGVNGQQMVSFIHPTQNDAADGNSNSGILNTLIAPDGGQYPISLMALGFLYNGTSWDRQRGVAGVTGSAAVGGPTAVDGPIAAAPVTVGGRASTAVPTAVSTDGDVVNLWASGNGALNVILRDTSGSAVATGSQYVEDAALGATGTGTLVIARRDDALATLTPVEDDAIGIKVNSRGALWVSISDGSGNQITSFGGGTSYTEDAPLGAVGSATGGLNIGRASAAAPTAVSADADAVAAWYLANGIQNVRMVDSAGAALSVGGGTQYVEDAALGATPTGTLNMARRTDTLATLTPVVDDAVSLRTNNRGALWVSHDGALAVTGTFWQTTQPVSGTVTANAGTGPFPVSDNAGTLTVDAPVGTPVYVRLSDGAANLIGQKAMAASLPVVIASDQFATPAQNFVQVPGLPVVSQTMIYDGTFYDRMRSVDALTSAPNLTTGILATGIGPGFDRKTNPTGVAATSTANAVTVTIDGADTMAFHVTTIGTTPGSMIFEGTGDDTNWATAGAVLKLGVETWVQGAFVPAVNDVYLVRCTGLRQVRYRVNAAYASGTATVKVTAAFGVAMMKSIDVGPAPHNMGYAIASATAQYTTTQTSVTLGPTVSATQRMCVTSIQIQAGGTTAGELQVYFGTGAYSRGTNKAIFDGEFAPSATLKPGFALAPAVPWMGAADEELKVTDSAAINKLTCTVWYYLVNI